MTAGPYRVLVVDDAVVVRRVVAEVLTSDPGIEVVGTAADGRAGVAKFVELHPDCVVLDLEMPELDGLGALREIRKHDRIVPVIMFSTLTERGAAATLEALAAGASDYVTKPTNSGSIDGARQQLLDELVPRVKQLCARRSARLAAGPRPRVAGPVGVRPSHAPARPVVGRPSAVDPGASGAVAPVAAVEPVAAAAPVAATPVAAAGAPGPTAAGAAVASGSRARTDTLTGRAPAPARAAGRLPVGARPAATQASPVPVGLQPVASGVSPAGRPRRAPLGRVDAVVVGVSTGGPNALAEVIPALPADLGVPVLVVQHMPPTFTRLLAERLDRTSALQVVEAAEGMVVRPGCVYVAPGDHHLVVRRAGGAVVCGLTQDAPENSCRPAVDVLFRAAAALWGANVLGVVMTGMGSDGTRGAQVLVAGGARVIAQDEATSVVWGMPGYVVRAGLAEVVLPLEEIAAEIVSRAGRPGPTSGGR